MESKKSTKSTKKQNICFPDVSPFDLILEILDHSNSDYASYWIELYKDNSSKLFQILDSILAADSGKKNFGHGCDHTLLSSYVKILTMR